MAPVSPAKQQVIDAYARTTGPVAFLDESYQAPDGADPGRATFYIFTAVLVELKNLDELRSGLLDVAGSTYWHTRDALRTDDGREQTRGLLAYLAEGLEPCVVAHRVKVDPDDHDAEESRKACYQALAVDLASGRAGVWDPVDLLVLEERNQRNFKNKDQANHKELVSGQRVARNTRLLQTSPAHERLLWLPDLVASAFRRTITHADRTLYQLIEGQVHFVNEA